MTAFQKISDTLFWGQATGSLTPDLHLVHIKVCLVHVCVSASHFFKLPVLAVIPCSVESNVIM